MLDPVIDTRLRKNLRVFLIYTLLIIFAVIFLIPIVWMISTSLKSSTEIYQTHIRIIPSKIEWQNYIFAVTSVPYFKYVWNTVIIAFFSVIGQLFAAPLVAYSLAKIRWGGSKIIFALVVSTMFLPYQVTMIPVYLIYYKLGFVGTFIPLILPNFFGYPFYIFLLRQFMMTLPDSLFEAARIDGASEFRIYWQITLPLIRPALATVAIFTFIGSWSDLLGPLIYLNDPNKYTLSLGLRQFLTEHSIEWGPLMAASIIFILPIIVIFAIAQKQFIEGITFTGIK